MRTLLSTKQIEEKIVLANPKFSRGVVTGIIRTCLQFNSGEIKLHSFVNDEPLCKKVGEHYTVRELFEELKIEISCIETETELLPYVIAQVVIEEVMMPKYLSKPFEEYQKAAKEKSYYLCNRAEQLFQSNKRFRAKVLAKGNKGRAYLYLFMYHWMGVTDSKIKERLTLVR